MSHLPVGTKIIFIPPPPDWLPSEPFTLDFYRGAPVKSGDVHTVVNDIYPISDGAVFFADGAGDIQIAARECYITYAQHKLDSLLICVEDVLRTEARVPSLLALSRALEEYRDSL